MSQSVRITRWIPILCCLALFACPTMGQTWSERAPIPTMRWSAAGVVQDGLLYVIGGQESAYPYSALPTCEAYDPSTDTWQVLAPMATPRWGLMAAALPDGRIMVAGGVTGTFSSQSTTGAAEIYDPATDTWTPVDPLPTHRAWGGCAVLLGSLYVFGGCQSPHWAALSAVEIYDPATGSWSADPPMPMSRDSFICAGVGDRAYLITGFTNPEPLTNLVQEYEPVSQTWTDKTPIPTARYFAGIAVRDGKIYIAGGRGEVGDELESYDPATDLWSFCEPLLFPREGVAGGGIGECVYVVAGSAPSPPGLPFYDANHEARFGGAEVLDPVGGDGAAVRLLRNHPNPFVGQTAVRFVLPDAAPVELAIFDVDGTRVRTLLTGSQDAGLHQARWDGRDQQGVRVPAGCYLGRLRAGDQTLARKIQLCR